MSTKSRKIPAIIALLLCLGFVSIRAEATIVVPLTLEQMQTRSNVIVRAIVLDSTSQWDRSEKHIFTFTRLKILETYKGDNAVGEIIRIRTLGGEVGGVGMAVAGTAKFQPSEEVVVFGRIDRYDAANFQIVGMSQGKFSVKNNPNGDAVVTADFAGLAFASTSEGKVTSIEEKHLSPTQSIRLSDLKSRLTEAQPQPAKVQPDAPPRPKDTDQ